MKVALVALAVAGVGLVAAGAQRRSSMRLLDVSGVTQAGAAPLVEQRGRSVPALRRLVRLVGGRLRSSSSTKATLERGIMLAGLQSDVRGEEVIGAQVLGALLGLALTVVVSMMGLAEGAPLAACGVCLVAAGALAPRVLLRRKGAARQVRLDAQVSDALDLLTLCVEAGLGFDAALTSVSESIPDPLGSELRLTVAEMRLGLSRTDALENLRKRTDSAAVNAAAVALVQADALGTPVGRILAAQAAEARLRRQQLAKERAAKLPVKILLPTVLLVFPPTFVILLGPAMSSLRGAF